MDPRDLGAEKVVKSNLKGLDFSVSVNCKKHINNVAES